MPVMSAPQAARSGFSRESSESRKHSRLKPLLQVAPESGEFLLKSRP